jgi:Domain of unknown function (DUF4338)
MPVTIGGGLSFCGREVTAEELDLIRQITRDFSALSLTELAHTVCELLEWRRPNGHLKSRECFVFLETLQQRGWLPHLPPRPTPTPRPRRTVLDPATDPQAPLTAELHHYLPLRLQLLETHADRRLFQHYLERYHYLGYRVPVGAQLRYFVHAQPSPSPLLACLLFTSAAWKMAPRDDYIGWGAAARQANLPRVINQSRFLILPWVRIPNLASSILARCARQLPPDWQRAYHTPPLLLETLVDESRYYGGCYRAANWIAVGLTQGRGRMDRFAQNQLTRKRIFLYPLRPDWRPQLCAVPALMETRHEPVAEL